MALPSKVSSPEVHTICEGWMSKAFVIGCSYASLAVCVVCIMKIRLVIAVFLSNANISNAPALSYTRDAQLKYFRGLFNEEMAFYAFRAQIEKRRTPDGN